MAADSRPLASVSLDADDLWSYLKTRGEPAWEARPSYLGTFIPLILRLLEEQELHITFFVVGFDAARSEHGAALRSLSSAGHEIGNHSFLHDCWLHRYSPEELAEDIERAEAAIVAATGQRPIGFRGPGFSWSPELLEVLARRGYLYDASTLPTFLGPLARWYFLRRSRLGRAEREQREALFGSWADGLRPVKPYLWRLADERTLLELPVTTVPGLRVPFHMSYLLYLSRYSRRLMAAYLRAAIAICHAARTEPSFLLHPLDVLGVEQVPELAFFPGMDLPSRYKIECFAEALGILGREFRLVPMSVHARRALEQGLPYRQPVLAT